MEGFSLLNYDKYLLSSNNDMKNILKMNNKFEESLSKFSESVKLISDLIRQKISENYQQRLDLEESFSAAI